MNTIRDDIRIMDQPVSFCYLIAVGAHHKIGHSKSVDGVLASARRFDASARLVSCWPGPNRRETEKTLHDGLKQFRVQNEQFELPTDALKWIASLDDREFAAWEKESNCDARAIGWDFPRVFTVEEKRVWASVYFPESGAVSWGMFASDTKPDYDVLERGYLQDHRGFNSAWLGRPKKFQAVSVLPPVKHTFVANSSEGQVEVSVS